MAASRVLLTGRPGVGKTTAILRVVEELQHKRLVGFFTREVRQGRRRTGFDAIGLRTGQCTRLATTQHRTGPQLGRYYVRVDAFDQFLDEEFGPGWNEADLLIIDEIGKMECFSTRFTQLVRTLLDSPLPILGTVAQRAGGFAQWVRNRPDVELIEVTEANRDALPVELARRFG